MNLKRARELYDDAKKILAEHGIIKFVEGEQFDEKLNNDEEAEDCYKSGLEKFSKGEIEEAISNIQLAADIAGVPLYKEKVAELREVRDKVKQMRQVLFARPPVPELLLQASAVLSGLLEFYGENPLLQPLQTQQEITVFQPSDQLFEKIDRYLYEAGTSSSMEASASFLEQARDAIFMLDGIGRADGEFNIRLSREQKKLSEIKTNLDDAQQFQSQIKEALAKHESKKVIESYQRLKDLFPWDRSVLALGEKIKEWGGSIPGKNRTISESNFRMERLEELLRADPTNQELLLNYEWERLHQQLNKREELFRQDRMANARAMHQQSNFWFYTSIVTAVLFMVVAIILIWLSFDRQNPWTAASSLLSLIPVLATKLVYQQALQANERADQLFEKIHDDNKQDQEMERQLFEHIRSRLFGESKLHTSLSEPKPVENRNI
jgi:hypothetical protein